MARDHDRLRGDQAGIGPDPGNLSRLHRLSDSHHYRIAAGEPDIRGWEVRTLSGSHLGEVEDLLIDPYRGEVVMLDVDLNNSREHVNVPIRGVQLDRNRRCVIVDSGEIRDAQESTLHADVHEAHRGHDVDERVKDMRDRGEVIGDTDDDADMVERRPVIEEVVVRRRVVDEEDID
jgi:sporulation protein YlmC with PRC-barrel domain